MDGGQGLRRNVWWSPFISTYEPIELPRDGERFLLESHNSHSRKTLVNYGRETTFDRDEFTLATAICIDSGEREPWRSGSALLIELRYDSSPRLEDVIAEMSEKIALQIEDAQYLADFADVSDDRFDDWDWTIIDWDWTITAAEVPLRLVDETVRGSLQIRGRALPIPRQLQAVGLDEYWAGQQRLVNREPD
jgi:hypothetical protein